MLVHLLPGLFSLSSLSVSSLKLCILENFTLYLRNTWSLNLRAIESCVCSIRSIERKMRSILRTVHVFWCRFRTICLCISCITWALNWDGPNIYSLLFLKIIFSVGNLDSSRGSRLNLSEATRPLQVEVGGQARRSRSVGPLEVSSASGGRTRREGSAGRKTHRKRENPPKIF